MKSNILYYYPSNKRTIAFNSLMQRLIERGYNMYLLTTCEKGVLHEDAETIGVKCFANPLKKSISFIYYLKQIWFLIKFCRKHKINFVLSNLQHVNFISVLAQYFISSKVIIYRHHFKYSQNTNDLKIKSYVNKNELFFDKIINKLAKTIIVPANSVKEGMVKYEGVAPNKIKVMQYLYNFDMYSKPDFKLAEELKTKYKAKLLLLMCSRLITLKRHHIVFPVIKKLVKENNYDIKLLVLDEGPEKQNLENYIITNKLEHNIYMLRYKSDFINYMQISDLMIHPSLTEASNSAVKEMALLNKTSIVCAGVGDFNDYFINSENGFIISTIDSEKHIEKILTDLYFDKSSLYDMGKKLHKTVLDRFSISEENVSKYISCFENA